MVYALELRQRFPGTDVLVIDKLTRLGGLLRSEIVNGFTFDIGGSHVIFSSNREILSKMLNFLNNGFVKHERRSFIRIGNALVLYPLENGLYALPLEDRVEALITFLEAQISRMADWKPRNLNEWIHGFFGKWIAEKYLVPYNRKVWKRDLGEIDVDWVYTPGRLPIPNWRDVVKSAMGIITIGYSEQAVFYYPSIGGIQSLYNGIAREIQSLGVKFLSGYVIESIRRVGDEWVINGKIKARSIVSSIPLNELVTYMDAPESVIRSSRRLDYNRVFVIGVALNKPAPNQHWVYVPSDDVVFHRYAWISNYSPHNAPRGRSSLLLEITIPRWETVNEEDLMNKALRDLVRLGVVNEGDVLFTKYWLHEYGYPVHTIESNRARDEVISWVKEQGITLIGRWGGCWRYWNTDKIYEDIIKRMSLKP